MDYIASIDDQEPDRHYKCMPSASASASPRISENHCLTASIQLAAGPGCRSNISDS